MGWQTDLVKLKEDSTDSAHLRHGKRLFMDLDSRLRNLIRRISRELEKPRVNTSKTDDDEKLRAREALKRVNFDLELSRIFQVYANAWPDLRLDYYKETMNKIGDSFNRNTKSYVKAEVSFTQSELAGVTDLVHGKKMNKRLNIMKARSFERVDDIVLDSAKIMPGIQTTFEANFRNQLRGWRRNMMAQFKGLLREMFTRIFEQGKERAFLAING